jgi:hypothetical protein
MSSERLSRMFRILAVIATTLVLTILVPVGSVPMGLTGTTASAVGLTQSNVALDFDGSNDIVDVGDVSALNGTSQYTIEMWVKFDSFAPNDTVFAKRVSDNDRAAMLQVFSADGRLAVAVNNGYAVTSESRNSGTWYHLAVVYDGTQATNAERLKLFVDGSPQALTYPFTGFDVVPATTPGTASRFTLGAEYNQTTPVNPGSTIIVPFEGAIDELRIWNVARTQMQIQANKDVELIGSETGLELYYNFSEGTPNGDNAGLTTVNDSAGTAQNGALWNFALNGASSNWIDGPPLTPAGAPDDTNRLYLPQLFS